MRKFTKLNYTEIETKKVNEFESSFSIAPLERGFANTLGNVVRRVLLSSISGVAPFAVKAADVEHEFQTISGLKEDAVQLILNLKKVRFVYNPEVFQDGEIIKVSLKSSGEGEITANDFILPAGVEVVDSSQVIATASKTGKLELELFLISGRGFTSFEENKELVKTLSNKMDSTLKTGSIITIDSDFSPIVNVSYESVELNTSAATIQEKLTINVKTDGSVEAKDAIAQAANILISHLEILADVSNIAKEAIFQEIEVVQDDSSSEEILVSSLELSVRSYNGLRRAGFTTLGQIAEISYDELSNIQNLGKRSIEEIIAKLEEHNITLKGGE